MTPGILVIAPTDTEQQLLPSDQIPLLRRAVVEVQLDEWLASPVVMVDDRCSVELTSRHLPRRPCLMVLCHDLDDASIWCRSVSLGAEAVVNLPDANEWLQLRLHEATGCIHIEWDRLLDNNPGGTAPSA